MLQLQSVNVSRGHSKILSNLSCTIKPGKLVALVGENGAGKSTLLHAIAGSLPFNGQIRLLNKPLSDWPAKVLAQSRAVMMQQNALNFHFEVPEFIAMGRFAIQESNVQKQKRVAQLIQLLDLQSLIQRHTGQLSGGQLQRVNMARCLAQLDAFSEGCRNKLLLLDEPTSALDLRYQHRLLQVTKDFVQTGNSAIVAIHDMNLASLYADEVILLHKGQLLRHDESQAVLTPELLEPIYHTRMHIEPHPILNVPMIFSQPAETDNEITSTF
ncbi:heme ABC transporter ATP-binding protein [Planctobacterium marinum]|uniref:Hemin import ATP-binding protein HmuV n=1 Tax=Planctobacterium marinum TaxID=1631968 RepID=A0AA48KPC7_9ALTE|nr:hemin import ATP-binding protein HmuV [Planctobacterium marinum]